MTCRPMSTGGMGSAIANFDRKARPVKVVRRTPLICIAVNRPVIIKLAKRRQSGQGFRTVGRERIY